MSIQQDLKQIHQDCDRHFTKAEELVKQENWDLAKTEFLAFSKTTQHHFSAEEAFLFPAIEIHIGASGGPTEVMRHEHEQMKFILSDLEVALEQKDRRQFKAVADTLLILIQQHNLKEEQILYPMADRFLAVEHAQILEQMRAP